MKTIARRQATVNAIFAKVQICKKYVSGAGLIAPVSRAYDDLMNYGFSKLYDMGNGVYKVTTFRGTWYELNTSGASSEEAEYQEYNDKLAAADGPEHLVVEVVVLLHGDSQAVTKTCAKCEGVKGREAFRSVANTVDGYARLCLDCEDENERQSRLNVQVATKVKKLAESLKHNKSDITTPVGELGYSNIPCRDLGDKSNFCFVLDCRKSLAGGGFGMYATSGYLDEDLYQRYMFHRCSEGASDITGNKLALASSMDKESTSFRPLSIDSSRLSRSALLRWFPVALENTTYSDAIVRYNTSSDGAIKRGYLVYSIANTRHYSNTTMRDKRVWYLGNKAI